MKKNVASQVVGAQLVAKADGTPVTSGTTTAYVTKDGGSQATGSVSSGACTHEGHGFWTYAPAQSETDADHVAFTFENSNAVNVTVQIYTSFPQSADAPTATQNADVLLKRDWTAVSSEASRSVLNALRFLRNKWTLAAGTLSVKKEDDSTDAWTAAVSTDAAAEPVIGSDPT